jgi:predicted ribosomally synthesized peptide with SipW-like signal peptide
MTDDGLDITRRKILGTVGAVGVASAGAGLGTTAFFNDTESFDDNSLTAGELDLKIDWQQKYDGPPDDGAPYGTAGSPYVNAHPDHNNDGEQSLDLSDVEGEDLTSEFGVTDPVVSYSDENANIQEYLTCETLDNHDGDSFDNGNVDQDHLIELSDVKPGDSGEVTFSFHLCDNPGYIYFTAGGLETSENGITEPEADSDDEDETSVRDASSDESSDVVELADAITVDAWYDLNCNNVLDDGENRVDPIFTGGTTLQEAFDGDLSSGVLLDPSLYSEGVDEEVISTQDCLPLGKVEGWSDDESDSSAPLAVDDLLNGSTDSTSGSILGYETENDRLEVYVLLENDQTGNQTIIRFFNLQNKDENYISSKGDLSDSEVQQFDFRTVPSYGGEESDADGICFVDLKAGNSIKRYEVRDGIEECSFGEENLSTEGDKTNGKGISYIGFYYCPDGAGGQGDGDFCFDPGTTYCVGFKWMIPEDVGNEIQSDSVKFDVGFYTEQCRHNEAPSGPGSDSS